MSTNSKAAHSKIQLLSQEVIHKIAAGEVVEKPAAAVKELIENSIDAGATQIQIRIVAGGLSLIEIKDNGFGMSREDLENCCQRHATSKIHSLQDLDAIYSLGFRGEALAALSAVSQLEITSKKTDQSEKASQSDNSAWLLKREGMNFSTQPASLSVGTQIRVQELFYNTPARKKFLKSEASETSQCIKLIRELSLTHPEIDIQAYFVSSKGELIEELNFKKQSRRERVETLLLAKEDSLFEVKGEEKTLGLSWEFYLQAPPHFSKNSKDLFFIVNSRLIEDKRLPYVLREAYTGLIEMGSFPRGALFLEVDPALVDVNVHPQKKEIRWPHQYPLNQIIYAQVKEKLQTLMPRSIPRPIVEESVGLFNQSSEAIRASRPPSESFNAEKTIALESAFFEASSIQEPQILQDQQAPNQEISQQNNFFSSLRVVGEVGAAWLLCESPEGMIIIDQHAAHERVNFHKFLNSKSLLSSQALLIPQVFKLPLNVSDRGEEILKFLEDWGFEGQCLDNALEFIAVPKSERKINWDQILSEVFVKLDQNLAAESVFHSLKVHVASSLACHGSVRRGQRLTHDEIKALLVSMDRVDWKEFCPHGRPTWKLYSHQNLEEAFHRS